MEPEIVPLMHNCVILNAIIGNEHSCDALMRLLLGNSGNYQLSIPQRDTVT